MLWSCTMLGNEHNDQIWLLFDNIFILVEPRYELKWKCWIQRQQKIRKKMIIMKH